MIKINGAMIEINGPMIGVTETYASRVMTPPPFPTIDERGQPVNWRVASLENKIDRSSFETWYAAWKSTPAAKRAIRKLNTLGPFNDEYFREFRQSVLFACWCASQYIELEITPEIARRLARPGLHKSVTAALETAVQLRKFLKEQPEIAKLIRPNEFTAITGVLFDPEKLAYELDVFAFGAQQLLQRGIFTYRAPHRRTMACVDYRRAVDDKNRPKNEAETGLYFELDMLFRQWARIRSAPNDAGNVPKLVDIYKIIFELGNAVFDPQARAPTEDSLKKGGCRVFGRLRKFKHDYPNSRFVCWPILII